MRLGVKIGSVKNSEVIFYNSFKKLKKKYLAIFIRLIVFVIITTLLYKIASFSYMFELFDYL